MSEKVNGSLSIKAYVECPHCEEMVNLFDIQRLRDDGLIWIALLGGEKLGTKDLDQEIDCPSCSEPFAVGEIEY